MSTDHHKPAVPLARLLPRVDDVANAASDAFWSVVADRFPEIHSGDMDPLTVAGMHTTFKELIETWLDGNCAWRPAVGQRVAFVREVQRFTEFTDDDEPDANPFVVVAAGTTGVVTVCSDDVMRVRLDEPLDGAEVLDNEISWGGAGEFMDTRGDFSRDIDIHEGESVDVQPCRRCGGSGREVDGPDADPAGPPDRACSHRDGSGREGSP